MFDWFMLNSDYGVKAIVKEDEGDDGIQQKLTVGQENNLLLKLKLDCHTTMCI